MGQGNCRPACLRSGKITEWHGYAEPATAIVCGNDIIAHGVIYAAHACKLELPDDWSIVGIGDFTGSAQIEPGLTTVRLPARRIGQLAADAIVKMSKNQQLDTGRTAGIGGLCQ